ncbi:MAG: alpha amylase, partial [Flavobacteriaceae bacterium]
PLIYAGDEIGTLNEYSFLADNDKKDDSRWANRPKQDWATIEKLDKEKTYHSKLFKALQKLIGERKKHPVFADGNNTVLYNSNNSHIFMYERTSLKGNGVLVICNFDENVQPIDRIQLGPYGTANKIKDLVSGKTVSIASEKLTILPFQLLWLVKK